MTGLEDIVAILSIIIGLPGIIFAYRLGVKYLKFQEKKLELKERELRIREEELDMEHEELAYRLRAYDQKSTKKDDDE